MSGPDCYWYSVNPVALALWPLSWLFRSGVALRRLAYRRGLLRCERLRVPVIVVGNITVGGSGKTPLVLRLVELLRGAGLRPGIISRGYGGRSRHWPRAVLPDSDPVEVGDEPLLLARRGGCPVVVAPDRVAAGQALLRDHECDVIVCDDGLQHYRLARDVEIVVIDAERRFGNGACLPAGPLREPPARLRDADFVVGNGAVRDSEYLMTLSGERAVNLRDAQLARPLSAFAGAPVHAVAGIGNPRRFFDYLRAQGLRVLEHPFPDHHPYAPRDLDFGDGLAVLMTEKDAVKCEPLARDCLWSLPVQAQLDPRLERRFLARVADLMSQRADSPSTATP